MAASKKNRPLEQWQKEDAARLKVRFDALGISQMAFAHEHGWKSQGTVSQYLLGRMALNLPALIKFCRSLNCKPSDISPRLAKELPDGGDVIPQSNSESAGQEVARDTKEAQILTVWRDLEEYQQKRILLDMLKFSVANDEAKKVVTRAGVKDLRKVPDSRVEEKFGFPPKEPTTPKGKRRLPAIKSKPKARTPDRAQDDTEGAP